MPSIKAGYTTATYPLNALENKISLAIREESIYGLLGLYFATLFFSDFCENFVQSEMAEKCFSFLGIVSSAGRKLA